MVRFDWLMLGLSTILSLSSPAASQGLGIPPGIEFPIHDNGLNDIVQWDHYSMYINGKRLFIFAGEFHYWRIPVPELWRDLLEKIKAAGFNGFSIYSNWGYHSPSDGVVDFTTGAHDFTPIFDLAKELGLYVIYRPGPYVNAEANAGGFPLWLTTGEFGMLRNNATEYTDAWEPYMTAIANLTSSHLVSKGGNVILYQIENELGSQWIGLPAKKVPNPPAIQYMELLEANARDNGIDVPLSANGPNMYTHSWSKDFSDAGGNVDVAGVDSYPSCWSCDLSVCASTNGPYVPFKVLEYYTYFLEDSITQPNYLAEFQGGSYNPWAGPEGGCPADLNEDFANLFYRHNVAQRVTNLCLYMLYGGTNWGSLAAPVVATSYDYSAPVSENRLISSKYYETKLLGHFLRVAHDLTVTEFLGNGTNYTTNRNVLATELRNPDKHSAFYVTIHSNSSVGTLENFKLHVNTSRGLFWVPRFGGSVALDGHQSKILVTDFAVGNYSIVYSTAEVLSLSHFDGHDTLVLWVPTGESGEFSVRGASSGKILSSAGSSNISFHAGPGELTTNFVQSKGISVVSLSNGLRVVILDRSAGYRFWAPVMSNDPFSPSNETILIQGPYLVRNATIHEGNVLITGDLDASTTITVLAAPKAATTISWNGETISTTQNADGTLSAYVALSNSTVVLPPLTNWKAADSLPERLESYSDDGAAWVDCTNTSTPNINQPATFPVLYVDDYGFHNGVHLWRGRFDGTPTSANITVFGGSAFGFSTWVNGNFTGSFLGSASETSGALIVSFANATLMATGNVLTVIQDNHGHDQTSGATNPRGIYNATLITSTGAPQNFTSWKVAGTAGGESNIDPVRGSLAEGGLYAERLGWHLPGFDDSAWTSTDSPSTGLSSAGVTFYRTVVPLNIPAGVDASISFVLTSPPGTNIRAQLFVGGYQYGRFVPHVGNQVVFPVPPGILNYNGDNTIGVAVWAQTEEGGKVDVSWRTDYVHTSSYDFKFDAEYLRPGWVAERLAYH